MKKQMSRMEIVKKVREMKREMENMLYKIEGAAIRRGDVETLVKMDVAVDGLVISRHDPKLIAEAARKTYSKKMQEADCKMVEVDNDWIPEFEEGEVYERPEWFVEEVFKISEAIQYWKGEQLDQIACRSDAALKMAADEIEMFDTAEMNEIRRLYKEIAA